MILGDLCMRGCRFCAVATGSPRPPAEDEPERLAEACEALRLRHAVITAVARDDLTDEGAGHFARCVRAVRRRCPTTTIEVLPADFHARRECIETVCEAGPDVYNHNLETVARLTPIVRPKADYRRSLEVLRIVRSTVGVCSPPPATHAAAGSTVCQPDGLTGHGAAGAAVASASVSPRHIRTKSGLMLGLGETRDEILAALADLRAVGCDMLTIGQYLQPSPQHLPVARFWSPQEFDDLAHAAREMGFVHVAAGPFVRSSYHAAHAFDAVHASG